MAHVSAEVAIGRPVDDVFTAAADRRQRMTLLPDNFDGARLVSENASGLGARFTFMVTTDRGAYRSETEIIAWTPTQGFVERTSDGETTYETHWTFTPSATGTLVRMRTEYVEAGNPVLRLLTRRFERRALEQSLLVELHRLRRSLEGDPGE